MRDPDPEEDDGTDIELQLFGPQSMDRLRGRQLLRAARLGDSEAGRAFLEYLARQLESSNAEINLDAMERRVLVAALRKLARFDDNRSRTHRVTVANVFVSDRRKANKGKQKQASLRDSELVYVAVNALALALYPSSLQSLDTPPWANDGRIPQDRGIPIEEALLALKGKNETFKRHLPLDIETVKRWVRPLRPEVPNRPGAKKVLRASATLSAIDVLAACLQFRLTGVGPVSPRLARIEYRKRVGRRYDEALVRRFPFSSSGVAFDIDSVVPDLPKEER
jgi:hypothetical protein